MFATLAAAVVVVWFAAGAWMVVSALWPARTVPVPKQVRRRRFDV
ncbi:MAG: hypothetical protein ACOYK7_16825 [Pirellulales bacterium]|jgi:hypothetical protein